MQKIQKNKKTKIQKKEKWKWKNAAFLSFICKVFLIQICMDFYILFGRVGNSAYITTRVMHTYVYSRSQARRKEEGETSMT
jgi:hypothetical protein